MPPSEEGEEVSVKVSLSDDDCMLAELFGPWQVIVITISEYSDFVPRLIEELYKVEKEVIRLRSNSLILDSSRASCLTSSVIFLSMASSRADK